MVLTINTITPINETTTKLEIVIHSSASNLEPAIGLLFKSFGNSVLAGNQEMLDFVVDKTKKWWVERIAEQEQKELTNLAESIAQQAKNTYLASHDSVAKKITVYQ
jgi:hypothetical protein